MPESRSLDALRIDRTSDPGERRRWPWILAVVLVAVAALVGWQLAHRGTPVKVAPATEVRGGAGGPVAVLDASGYVTARRKATVSSKVTGKVAEVLVEEGMHVTAGQVLARLDDASVRRTLALAEAQAAAARTALREIDVELRQARLDLGRAQNLAQQGVSAQAQLDAAKAQVDALAARLAATADQAVVAERQVGVARQELADLEIRAPFAGVAISKDAQPGEMISPVSAGGGFTRTGICTLVDMDSLEIEVDVNESYIQRVEPGQKVTARLDAYPDWEIPAHVLAVVPAADREKATVKVRIALARNDGEPLDPRILPDMGVKVSFQGPATTAAASGGTPTTARAVVAVPRSAVRGSGADAAVFVLQGDHVERRAVTTGVERGDEVQVVAGVGAGEQVVIEGPETLADGDRVRVESEAE